MTIGHDAPGFRLPDESGEMVSLRDFEGTRLIVFFYPRAMTPGCTTEACDFRDSYGALREAGFALVGVSPDPPERNQRFKEKERLPFPLLSDEDHRVAAAFGAWGIKKSYGREFEGLIRSTFVIGSTGKVEIAYRNVRARGHVARLTKEVLGG